MILFLLSIAILERVGSERPLCPISGGNEHFGYIQVSKHNQYFYSVIEADNGPQTAPTFLLIEGGFGASSLSSVLQQSGPCIMDISGKLQKNIFSWTQQANGIWVDAPAPTGFSKGAVESGWKDFIQNMINFVNKIFELYPHLNTKVHLVGNSAAASVVATVGARIAKAAVPKIHLVGVLMTSGAIDPYTAYYGTFRMVKDNKLLPPDEVNKMELELPKCKEQISKCNSPGGSPPADVCMNAARTCDNAFIKPVTQSGRSIYDVRAKKGNEGDYFQLHAGKIDSFLNNAATQAQLGVSKPWIFENKDVLEKFFPYNALNTADAVTQLLDMGLKVIVVNGLADLLTNAIGSFEWISNLKGKEKYGEKFQKVPDHNFVHDKNLGLYRQLKYSNGAKLGFLQVYGGHYLIEDQPRGMHLAFQHFLSWT